MGPAPGQSAADDGGPTEAAAAGQGPAPFPDLDAYVDLVSELEEILRSAAAEPAPLGEMPGEDAFAANDPDDRADALDPAEAIAPEAATLPVAQPAPPRAAPLRVRARSVPPEPPSPVRSRLESADPDEADDPPPLPSSFWQVDDAAWAAAPAWREPARARKTDLLIIGALVVLIAGGGAYSAIRFGDDAAAPRGETVADASRAEAGLGVPFAPVGRTALLRDDPTAPVPSLEAAIAGPEVTPLPVIVEPPVEVTQPIFLADAAPAAPVDTPAGPAGADVPPAGGVGGPMVPLDPVVAEAGVPVGIVTTVTTWVNMRAGPDNAEPVVVVVSPDTPVAVRACDYWCRVSVNGQDGYIFRDFLVDLP
ncbi:MAG: hypothetical protein IT534_01300 [Bauldia sp.]|nr:hypothetical protein [Bauldia sp.]